MSDWLETADPTSEAAIREGLIDPAFIWADAERGALLGPFALPFVVIVEPAKDEAVLEWGVWVPVTEDMLPWWVYRGGGINKLVDHDDETVAIDTNAPKV